MKISEYKLLFLSEAREILNTLNCVLVDLEKEPSNAGLIDELFRQSHTFKSMAQSMGYGEIARLTHSMESTFALLRGEKTEVEKDLVDLLFKSLDALADLIEEKEKGTTGKVKVTPLIDRFEEIAAGIPADARKHANKLRLSEPDAADPSTDFPGQFKTVRVPLTHLDNLMDLTGELAINRIRLSQIAQTIEDSDLKEAVDQFSKLTSQLQDQVMQVRIVPLKYIFAPYPRMVRDMAVDQKKEVDFIIEGGHIGLDRSIQDEINEPLLHLLKNAVTHGIEEPEQRRKLRKPPRGIVRLSAGRERNFVVIVLSDDGRGIDVEEIKKAALQKGMATQEELSSLSPKEAMMLVSRPGYTSTKTVTEAAGRGVGLDAAKIKVESLGGTLEIDTKPNEGTTLSFRLPLTTAIVQAMLVNAGGETYCIPSSHIAETIKIAQQDIKTIDRHEVISYRDTVLPLIRVVERFGFASSTTQFSVSQASAGASGISVVVVEAGVEKMGLIVDKFLGQQEIVIKPLTGMLKEVKGASGVTILGTGKPAIVMDVGSSLKKEVLI